MSETRFQFLTTCIRFDDMTTQEERKKQDKFAPIRELWDNFLGCCKGMYVPHENLIVDKQLLGFHRRCYFRVYITFKPTKYGIKLILLVDNNSKYLLGAELYLGKQALIPQGNLSLGHYYTKHLTMLYHNTNRNITMDKWFTSIPLACG